MITFYRCLYFTFLLILLLTRSVTAIERLYLLRMLR